MPEEDPEQACGEPAEPRGGVLESVLEEACDALSEAGPDPQAPEEHTSSQAEAGRPQTASVHGPYYYFYQGRMVPRRTWEHQLHELLLIRWPCSTAHYPPCDIQCPSHEVLARSSCFFFSPSAEDCQQMFLHPVNVRCLLREYGSLEASPHSITATVVEIEGQTVTDVRPNIVVTYTNANGSVLEDSVGEILSSY